MRLKEALNPKTDGLLPTSSVCCFQCGLQSSLQLLFNAMHHCAMLLTTSAIQSHSNSFYVNNTENLLLTKNVKKKTQDFNITYKAKMTVQ